MKRLPVAAVALIALVVLGALEWPWTSAFSMHGESCNVAERCTSPEARGWLVGTRCTAVGVVLLWIGSALRRTWTRGAGGGPIGSDVSLRVAAPLAAAGLVVAAGWFGAAAALMSMFVGSIVAGATILTLTLLGLVRVLERVIDSTWGNARPDLAAQLAWLAPLVGALAALAAAAVGGRVPATPCAAVAVALVVATCDVLARRGLRSLAIPLALLGLILLAALAVVGYLAALTTAFFDEAATPIARPSAASATHPPTPGPEGRPPVGTRTAPLPTGVPATRDCRSQDLEMVGGGWDFAMGKSAMSITARNISPDACRLDGIPRIRITQGGKDLHLTYEPGSAESIGLPGNPRPVGVPAGGEATAVLWWPGYRDAADRSTPQHLYAAAVPGHEVAVPLNPPPGSGPAPFDLVDGGRVVVSAWSVIR